VARAVSWELGGLVKKEGRLVKGGKDSVTKKRWYSSGKVDGCSCDYTWKGSMFVWRGKSKLSRFSLLDIKAKKWTSEDSSVFK
jgi:hypothetical protein